MQVVQHYHKHIISISPKHETLKVIRKTYIKKGKRLRVAESQVLKEVSIKHVQKVKQEREVTKSYFDFGLQQDTSTIEELLYNHLQIDLIIEGALTSIGLNASDYYFASTELITKP